MSFSKIYRYLFILCGITGAAFSLAAQEIQTVEPLINEVQDIYASSIPEWMKETYLSLKTWQWIGLFFAVVVGIMLRSLSGFIASFGVKLLKKTGKQWNSKFLKEIKKPIGILIPVWFWILSLHLLMIESKAHNFLQVVLQILQSIGLIWFAYRFSDILTEYLRLLTNKTDSTLDDQLVPLLNKTIKVCIVLFGALVTFQNLGINVMSLVAGLGIGGLAFALAAKDTVANFFGSLMIIFDQPFQVGDWIKVKSAEGTVEEIGFRSTRIRTFYNSLITIPNADLMNEVVDNMGQRKYRRILHYLGLKYDTEPEKIEEFIKGIKDIIKENPFTRKDYYHVVFHEYGPDSLVIMMYLFLEVPDWTEELLQKQNLFLEILKLSKKIKVEFAFPTQTLHVESLPEYFNKSGNIKGKK